VFAAIRRMSSARRCFEDAAFGLRLIITPVRIPNEMSDFGKLLVVLGLVLIIVGGILVFLGRTNLPLGRLPGDIVYRGKNTTFYFPLATSILLSIILSIVFYVLGKWRR
jgi:hypothetical protein